VDAGRRLRGALVVLGVVMAVYGFGWAAVFGAGPTAEELCREGGITYLVGPGLSDPPRLVESSRRWPPAVGARCVWARPSGPETEILRFDWSGAAVAYTGVVLVLVGSRRRAPAGGAA
jgi:hypothetical protein